jgi:hypothetical protein
MRTEPQLLLKSKYNKFLVVSCTFGVPHRLICPLSSKKWSLSMRLHTRFTGAGTDVLLLLLLTTLIQALRRTYIITLDQLTYSFDSIVDVVIGPEIKLVFTIIIKWAFLIMKMVDIKISKQNKKWILLEQLLERHDRRWATCKIRRTSGPGDIPILKLACFFVFIIFLVQPFR